VAEFPMAVPVWGTDNMVTCLRVIVEKLNTGKKEQIALVTIMKLKSGHPYRMKDGKRRIDVRIKRWGAKGYSPFLDSTIEYRLSKDVDKPISYVESKSKEEDFPASMTFNAIFDVFVDGKKVISETEGTARAERLMRIPPDEDDLFLVDKEVAFDNIKLTTIDCPTRFAITRKHKCLI